MKVSVLTIINKLDFGGIEKTFLSSIKLFNELGYKCHVLCTKGGDLERDVLNEGCGISYFHPLKNPILDVFRMINIVIKHKFDLVHVRDGFTSGFYVLACRVMNIPIIVSIHSSESNFKKEWTKYFFLKHIRFIYLLSHKLIIKYFASAIIGHSANNLRFYTSGKPLKKNYYIVYNGVNFNRLNLNQCINKNSKNNTLNLIHIGSFKKQKNHESIIYICKSLLDRGHKLNLILCGEGFEKKRIISLVDKLNISEYIIFAGNVKNIDKFLLQSDILLFPSLNEGFGNVIIEAQYCKVAICASDIPPHYESVCDVYHKFFFKPTNVAGAVEQIERLSQLISQQEIEPYLDTAYNFSLRFSIENMVYDLNKIFKSVINK